MIAPVLSSSPERISARCGPNDKHGTGKSPHPLDAIGGQPVPPATGEPGRLGQIGRGLRIGLQGQGETIGDMLGAPGGIARLGIDATEAGGRDLSNLALGQEDGAAFRDQLSGTTAGSILKAVGSLLGGVLPTSDELKTGFTNELRAAGSTASSSPKPRRPPAERTGKAANRLGPGSGGSDRASGAGWRGEADGGAETGVGRSRHCCSSSPAACAAYPCRGCENSCSITSRIGGSRPSHTKAQ